MADPISFYKDDLPNAFNGPVDTSRDYISSMPVETADNILSYLLLDHDPDRGVKKAAKEPEHVHVLVSISAMSRHLYHLTESFCGRFLRKHKSSLYHHSAAEMDAERLERSVGLRRSARLVGKDQVFSQDHVAVVDRRQLIRQLQVLCAQCFEYMHLRATFANATLTDAMKDFDLRDYMLLKARKPGPRAKHTDLPEILYSSDRRSLRFPAWNTVTSFTFRGEDVEKLAALVHGDVEAHMALRMTQKQARDRKARCKRVLDAKLKYHEERLEITTGQPARGHAKGSLIVSSKGASKADLVQKSTGCWNSHPMPKTTMAATAVGLTIPV